MYEKPQYLTPGGYKRVTKNPYAREQNSLSALRIKRDAVLSKKEPATAAGAPVPRVIESPLRKKMLESMRRTQPKTIDDKTAKLIALAIKGMLHSR